MTLNIPAVPKSICEILQRNDHQAVIAGGAVRDLLLGETPNDFDVATSASPDEVETIFESLGGFHTVPVGKSFGVVRVLFCAYPMSEEVEVATFRSDGNYSDGRRPDNVEFCGMEEDARRRDMSICGLFYDPISEELHDFVNGEIDLRHGIVRAIGNPIERIREDNLRILRYVRFAVRFGFRMDKETESAIKRTQHLLGNVSRERIRDELVKMFAHENAYGAMSWMHKLGLWSYIIPEVKNLWDSDQEPEWHPEGTVGNHTNLMLGLARDSLPNNPVLALGILFHDIAKPHTFEIKNSRITNHGHAEVGAEVTEEIMRRLKFDNETIRKVCQIVRNHMKFGVAIEMKRSTRMKMYARDTFQDELELHRVDCMSANRSLINYYFLKRDFQHIPPAEVNPKRFVNGYDLLEMGLDSGPELGRVLDIVYDAQLDGTVVDQDAALEMARNITNTINNPQLT